LRFLEAVKNRAVRLFSRQASVRAARV